MYTLTLAPRADEDLDHFTKLGDKSLLRKIEALFDELRNHPETGTGKPERLKGSPSGLWSRRINDKHRMVYQIEKFEITVYVLSLRGHYGNK
jgi:toxin YoeB